MKPPAASRHFVRSLCSLPQNRERNYWNYHAGSISKTFLAAAAIWLVICKVKNMASINVKISEDLKDQSYSVLREHGLNATQYITLCCQYLARHGRLPFITETRVLPPRDAIAGLAVVVDAAVLRETGRE